jgi:hypothetical protein
MLLTDPKSIPYNSLWKEWKVFKIEGKDQYSFSTDYIILQERITDLEEKYKYRIIFCSTNDERPFGETDKKLENGNEYFVMGFSSKIKEIEEVLIFFNFSNNLFRIFIIY